VITAIAFEFKGLAEESQDVVPGVEGAVDDGGNPVFGVVMYEVIFEDCFPGARFAEDEAEPTLLGVDFEDVEVALLMLKEWSFFIDDEGVTGEAEVLPDHFLKKVLGFC